MGIKHSTPAPTEEDFLVEHEPPSSILCKQLPPKTAGATYDFVVKCKATGAKSSFAMKQNCWNLETPVVDLLEGMKLVPKDSARCLLVQNTTPLAVLMLVEKDQQARICSFTPSRPYQPSCGEHDGRSLFQWAVVAKREESHQYTMKTTADNIEYATDFFGSASSQKNLVLKRQGHVCASLQEPKWKCRIGPGIDPAMIVCFLACHDKLQEFHSQRLRDLQYVPSYKISDVLHP
jgi:hypothetical protein